MNYTEKFTEKLLFSGALLSAFITLLIFGFMIIPGLPLLRDGHFFDLLIQLWNPDHNCYGIYPMIVGSLSIAFFSLILAFPLSIGCSALITVFAPKGFGRILKVVVQFMTGIPTVIYGFVGIFLLVPIIREFFQYGSGLCILSASLMLSILISPTMILIFTNSFDQVPASYLNAIDAIGGSKVQKLIYIIIPNSYKGILTGIILSLGRAMGDTMISLMIAGNAVTVPDSVLNSARTLTAHIALIIAADFDSPEFKSLFICGITLYLFTIFITIIIRCLEPSKRMQI